LPESESFEEPAEALPALDGWVRGTLVGITVGLVAVFAVARWLEPYDENGAPLRMETHRKLGLPPCTFKTVTGGMPCPSCGMTTSFALLARGDVGNSLRANAVGTMLALFCALLIPWSVATLLRGRPLFIVSMERAILRVVIFFLLVMLLRWVVVLAIYFWPGS
jgi:hypothetical protein